MTLRLIRQAALALPLLAAAPAAAQDEEGRPDDPNSLTIGIGGAYVPSYEGSDDYGFTPIGVAFGKVGGFSFTTRGSGIALDLIRDPADASVEFALGPVAHLRFDRTGGIEDAQVKALGEIDRAFELGAYVGVKANGLLNQYDSLAARVAWQTDISNTHDSSIVTPAIDYETPLGPKTYASLGWQAEHVGDGYAATYFGVTPAGAVASGLPVYAADGGWKNWRASLILAQVLTGDLRDPGLSIFGGVAYSRLLGGFKRSPIVAIAGDADQYFATVGLSYTF